MAIKLSLVFARNIKFLIRKDIQNTISKTLKIAVTISIAFKNFDFVISTFCKTISY